MKSLLIIVCFVFGCGEDRVEPEHSCEHYDNLYSHSEVLCDDSASENIETTFVACNSRVPREQHREGCLDDYDLIDVIEGCWIEHVCYDEILPRQR